MVRDYREGSRGYDVNVHNHAEEVAPPHTIHDSGNYICAKIVDLGREGGRACSQGLRASFR